MVIVQLNNESLKLFQKYIKTFKPFVEKDSIIPLANCIQVEFNFDNITMRTFTMKESCEVTLNIECNEHLVVCINYDRFEKIISSFKNDEIIELWYYNDNNYPYLSVNCITNNKVSSNYEFEILNEYGRLVFMPDRKYSFKTKMVESNIDFENLEYISHHHKLAIEKANLEDIMTSCIYFADDYIASYNCSKGIYVVSENKYINLDIPLTIDVSLFNYIIKNYKKDRTTFGYFDDGNIGMRTIEENSIVQIYCIIENIKFPVDGLVSIINGSKNSNNWKIETKELVTKLKRMKSIAVDENIKVAFNNDIISFSADQSTEIIPVLNYNSKTGIEKQLNTSFFGILNLNKILDIVCSFSGIRDEEIQIFKNDTALIFCNANKDVESFILIEAELKEKG